MKINTSIDYHWNDWRRLQGSTALGRWKKWNTCSGHSWFLPAVFFFVHVPGTWYWIMSITSECEFLNYNCCMESYTTCKHGTNTSIAWNTPSIKVHTTEQYGARHNQPNIYTHTTNRQHNTPNIHNIGRNLWYYLPRYNTTQKNKKYHVHLGPITTCAQILYS